MVLYFFPFTYHFFYNSTRLENQTYGHVISITFCKTFALFHLYQRANAEQMGGECPMARVVRLALHDCK